jgi:hypothetical protein
MDGFCKKVSDRFLLGDNVVLHVLVLFALLSGLFVFYIAKLTEKAFNHEFTALIDESLNPNELKEIIEARTDLTLLKEKLKKYFSSDKIDILATYMNELKETQFNNASAFFDKVNLNYKKDQDRLRKENNRRIHEEIILIIGFFIILAIAINFLSIKFGNCGVLKHLGVELLVIFSFIGAIEYWFFTNVASKYVPVNPDVLTKSFQSHINELLK